MSLTSLVIVASETATDEPAIHPYAVGGLALGILLAAMADPADLRRRARAQLSMTDSGPGRRRVGVMGGTFDPIHHGHLVAASEVQAWFDLDEVVFVPTGDPWQKSEPASLAGRAPLPDDGDRDRLQPARSGCPGSTSTATGRRTPSTRCAT